MIFEYLLTYFSRHFDIDNPCSIPLYSHAASISWRSNKQSINKLIINSILTIWIDQTIMKTIFLFVGTNNLVRNKTVLYIKEKLTKINMWLQCLEVLRKILCNIIHFTSTCLISMILVLLILFDIELVQS